MEAAIQEYIELLQCKLADLHASWNQLLIVSDESQNSNVQALWSEIVQMETLVAEIKTAHLARLREFNRCVLAMDSWRHYCEGRAWSYPSFSVRVPRWPVLKHYVRPKLMISEFDYTPQPELNASCVGKYFWLSCSAGEYFWVTLEDKAAGVMLCSTHEHDDSYSCFFAMDRKECSTIGWLPATVLREVPSVVSG